MQKDIDLTSISKKSFWKLAIPIIGFSIFDAIYGIIDMIWISKISVEAFFAIGISIPIVTFIYACGVAVGQGTNSIMSRFIGSGDYESAYNALIHGMLLANLIWVILVLCLIFSHGILFYIDEADSYILVFDYLFPIVVFAYLFIFNNLFTETLQAEGNSAAPNSLIIASYILNIILDPIFIFNLNLGIKGAAYATVLSAFLVFIAITYLYISGHTKVPLSLKYFKFHTYIFVEIFKVAIPNILNEGVECFASSFINSMLLVTMGAPGPILYSVCLKLKVFLLAPVKGTSRALMSVTGHLFGAEKFDESKDMFKYVVKASSIILIILMIIFFLFRQQIFGLFSITGMETEIFWIALGGAIYIFSFSFCVVCARMYDGFGKSIYTLLLVFVEVGLQIGIISGLCAIEPHGNSVLIAMVVSEIVTAVLFYLLLRYLFNNFDKKYEGKSTVKNLDRTGQDDEPQDIDDKIDDIVEKEARKLPSRLPLIIALIAMIIIFLQILSIPIKQQNYALLISGVASLIICGICLYLMEISNKPKLSVIGFVGVSIILLLFMKNYGYLAATLLIIAGILVLYIDRIIKILKWLGNENEEPGK